MRTNPRSFAVAALLALAPTVFPQPAFAQPAAAAADPTVAAARARFSEGVQFYDKGEYENARASFLQAYALHKHPAVLINLAQSALRSGHTLEADRFFTRYLHESASLSPAQRAEADKGLAEARTKLGRIDVIAAPGIAVTIDGELAGTDGSTTMDVEPGVHAVKGGVDSSSVTVAAGQTVMVKLGKAAGAAPVPATAPVDHGTSPPASPPPPETPPAETTRPPATPEASKSSVFSAPSAMAPVWAGVGVGVAGFVTAVILGVSKSNAQSSYNGQVSAIQTAEGGPAKAVGKCTNPPAGSPLANGCASLTDDANDVSTDATIGNVGIVVGVVGLAFAASWYLFAPKADAAKPGPAALRHVQPVIGPHIGGMSLGGTF